MAEHPRVRGENLAWALLMPLPYGTSPRARGKPGVGVVGGPGGGNIPACAGKTCSASLGTFRAGEHPRVRGENGGLIPFKPESNRNIPACAGKTLIDDFTLVRIWEHPRVRGEN